MTSIVHEGATATLKEIEEDRRRVEEDRRRRNRPRGLGIAVPDEPPDPSPPLPPAPPRRKAAFGNRSDIDSLVEHILGAKTRIEQAEREEVVAMRIFESSSSKEEAEALSKKVDARVRAAGKVALQSPHEEEGGYDLPPWPEGAFDDD